MKYLLSVFIAFLICGCEAEPTTKFMACGVEEMGHSGRSWDCTKVYSEFSEERVEELTKEGLVICARGGEGDWACNNGKTVDRWWGHNNNSPNDMVAAVVERYKLTKRSAEAHKKRAAKLGECESLANAVVKTSVPLAEAVKGEKLRCIVDNSTFDGDRCVCTLTRVHLTTTKDVYVLCGEGFETKYSPNCTIREYERVHRK